MNQNDSSLDRSLEKELEALYNEENISSNTPSITTSSVTNINVLSHSNTESVFGISAQNIWKQRKRSRTRGVSQIDKDIGEARNAFVAGYYGKAADLLLEIIKKSPKKSDPYYIMALIYEELGKKEECFKLYRLAATYSARSLHLWIKVCSLATDLGYMKTALTALNKATVYSKSLYLMSRKILILVEMGQVKKAEQLLLQFISKYGQIIIEDCGDDNEDPKPPIDIIFEYAQCCFSCKYTFYSMKVFMAYIREMLLTCNIDLCDGRCAVLDFKNNYSWIQSSFFLINVSKMSPRKFSLMKKKAHKDSINLANHNNNNDEDLMEEEEEEEEENEEKGKGDSDNEGGEGKGGDVSWSRAHVAVPSSAQHIPLCLDYDKLYFCVQKASEILLTNDLRFLLNASSIAILDGAKQSTHAVGADSVEDVHKGNNIEWPKNLDDQMQHSSNFEVDKHVINCIIEHLEKSSSDMALRGVDSSANSDLNSFHDTNHIEPLPVELVLLYGYHSFCDVSSSTEIFSTLVKIIKPALSRFAEEESMITEMIEKYKASTQFQAISAEYIQSNINGWIEKNIFDNRDDMKLNEMNDFKKTSDVTMDEQDDVANAENGEDAVVHIRCRKDIWEYRLLLKAMISIEMIKKGMFSESKKISDSIVSCKLLGVLNPTLVQLFWKQRCYILIRIKEYNLAIESCLEALTISHHDSVSLIFYSILCEYCQRDRLEDSVSLTSLNILNQINILTLGDTPCSSNSNDMDISISNTNPSVDQSKVSATTNDHTILSNPSNNTENDDRDGNTFNYSVNESLGEFMRYIDMLEQVDAQSMDMVSFDDRIVDNDVHPVHGDQLRTYDEDMTDNNSSALERSILDDQAIVGDTPKDKDKDNDKDTVFENDYFTLSSTEVPQSGQDKEEEYKDESQIVRIKRSSNLDSEREVDVTRIRSRYNSFDIIVEIRLLLKWAYLLREYHSDHVAFLSITTGVLDALYCKRKIPLQSRLRTIRSIYINSCMDYRALYDISRNSIVVHNFESKRWFNTAQNSCYYFAYMLTSELFIDDIFGSVASKNMVTGSWNSLINDTNSSIEIVFQAQDPSDTNDTAQSAIPSLYSRHQLQPVALRHRARKENEEEDVDSSNDEEETGAGGDIAVAAIRRSRKSVGLKRLRKYIICHDLQVTHNSLRGASNKFQKQISQFLDKCYDLNVECGEAAERFFGYPVNIAAGNELWSKITSVTNYDNVMMKSFLSDVSLMHPQTCRLKTGSDSETFVLHTLHAHSVFDSGDYGKAIQLYMSLFVQDPSQPLISLCLSSCLLHMSQHPFSARQDCYVRGLAFLAKYATARMAQVKKSSDITSNTSYEELCLAQEINFNIACTFHEVGLAYLAELFFLKAVMVEDTRRKCDLMSLKPSATSWEECLPLTRQAGHNLVLIYKKSNSADAAYVITRDYLSI